MRLAQIEWVHHQHSATGARAAPHSRAADIVGFAHFRLSAYLLVRTSEICYNRIEEARACHITLIQNNTRLFEGRKWIICRFLQLFEGKFMSTLWLSNAQVLDTRAGQLLTNRHVLIRDGFIVEVSEQAPNTGDTERIDVGGRVLMPGLCDGHVHVTAATANLAAMRHWSPTYVAARSVHILEGMLMRGFTTVRDGGGADWGLAKAIEEGYITGPRVFFCGHGLSQTGGHGDMRGSGDDSTDFSFTGAGIGLVCDGVSEMRRACREEIRRGAHHIKLMVSGGVASPTDRIDSTQFAEDEIRAAVEEAEAANIYVMVHAYTARAINRALRCGVRTIEHGNLLDESSIELFLETGAYLVPTLSTYQALADEGIAGGLPPQLHSKIFDVLDAGKKALELAYRSGVKLVYGTDLLGDMHRRQLDEFTIRGAVIPPVDVLRSATCNAADLLQRAGELGEVVAGARADLLVVDGNPLDDLNVMTDPEKNLRLIMKDGKTYKNTLA
jgi:imidazolonepropionase-like amidohydrolase